jgi:hypothetical protein
MILVLGPRISIHNPFSGLRVAIPDTLLVALQLVKVIELEGFSCYWYSAITAESLNDIRGREGSLSFFKSSLGLFSSPHN